MSRNHMVQLGGGVWHFRMRVPDRMRAKVGKRWWQHSLGTRDERQAGRKRDAWVVHYRGVVETFDATGGRTWEQIDGDHFDLSGVLAKLPEARRREIQEVMGANPDVVSAFVEAAGEALRSRLVPVPADRRGRVMRDAAVGQADADADLLADFIQEGTGTGDVPDGRVGMTELLARWELKKVNAGEDHRRFMRQTVELWEEFVSWKKFPREVVRTRKAHVIAFADMLRTLPSLVVKETRGKSLSEVMDIAKREGLPPADAATANRKLTAIKTLFQYGASILSEMEGNPASAIELLEVPRKKAKKRAFRPNEIEALFQYIGGKFTRDDDRYWIPRFAFYQGSRLEETCQLLRSDIKQIGGIWCADIVEEDNDDGDVSKRLKNSNARRIVPLNLRLIADGFLEFVQGREDMRLFASLVRSEYDGRLGRNFGKSFRLTLDNAGVTDRGVTFHSFRHHFISAGHMVGVTDDELAPLVGHGSGLQVTGEYRKGALIAVPILAERMQRIVLPDLPG